LLNATTARLVARLLGVIQASSESVLIVGANNFAMTIAKYLQDQKRSVTLIDSNPNNIRRARAKGLKGLVANVFTDDLSDEYELLDVGYMLALTSSNEVNAYALKEYGGIFGELGGYRLITSDEVKKRQEIQGEDIFSYTDDFLDISEAHRESATIHEKPLRSLRQFKDIMAVISAEKYIVPLFLKHPDGKIHVVPPNPATLEGVNSGGYTLVYLGEDLAGVYAEEQ
ncbi:MAG: NAD-binding protein, partial [Bacteroidota bacterium]